MSMRVTVLLVLVLAAAALVVANPILPEVGYQVHSYDDLREWPQVLFKGANYLKIDAHFLDPNFCRGQERVADPSMGCFVLTHDLPLSIAGRAPYNTTEDVLAFIVNSDYRQYFTAPAPRVAIALCFKYDLGGPCDGSPRAANWTKLVDRFFNMANNIITKYGLTVDFVMDGSGTPNTGRQCLKDKWRPWISTWIVGQDDMAAATSDDVAAGFDRFQINNMAEGIPSAQKLEIMKKIGYGKFAKTQWPYQLWEPSDQQNILDILGAYSSGPHHAPGFRFSINIDPVQFQVYAAPATGNAWNTPLPFPSPFATGSTPQLVVARIPFAPPVEGKVIVAIIVTHDPVSKQILYQPYTIDQVLGSWKTLQTAAALPLPNDGTSDWDGTTAVASVSNGVSIDGTQMLLVTSNQGGWVTYDITGNSKLSPLSIQSNGRFASLDKMLYSTMALATSKSTPGFAWVQILGTDKCAIGLRVFQSTTKGEQVTQRGTTTCLQQFAAGNITSASVDAVAAQSPTSPCGSSPADGLAVLFVYSQTIASVSSVYTLSICVNLNVGFVSASSSVKLIGVGSHPRVTLFSDPSNVNDYRFAIVATDGFCFNNVADNTKAAPALCDIQPVALPSVMTYTMGWFNVLNQYHIRYNNTVTPCSPWGVVHGMYDMGTAPAVKYFSDDNGSVCVLEVHAGISASVADIHRCGRAISRTGSIMMDSFIPHYI